MTEVQVAVADRKHMSVHFVQVKSLRLSLRQRRPHLRAVR